jgi:hypothetical protein
LHIEVETQVAALQSALEAAADGSELKRTITLGEKFRALHLKLSPKYVCHSLASGSLPCL